MSMPATIELEARGRASRLRFEGGAQPSRLSGHSRDAERSRR
jgi:hypothetical protein